MRFTIVIEKLANPIYVAIITIFYILFVVFEENIKKGSQVLLDIVGVIASIIRAVVSLVRLAYDIMKDRKQKSNRPPKE